MPIPLFSVFIEHEYLQNGGGGSLGHHDRRYQTYLFSASYALKDAVPFAYGARSLARRNARADLGKQGRIKTQ